MIDSQNNIQFENESWKRIITVMFYFFWLEILFFQNLY